MKSAIATRFANIPRLSSFADQLRCIHVRGASADSHADTRRNQIDGRSNGRGSRHANGRPHSSNSDSQLTPFPTQIL